MKQLLLALLIMISAGCISSEVTTNNPNIESEQTDPPVPYATSTYNDFLPQEALIIGNISTFTEVNSDAYQIDLDYERISTFVYHESGRVMTQLVFQQPWSELLDDQSRTLTLNSSADLTEFFAMVCQSDGLENWDYDSHADNGTIEITPIGADLWVVDYDLAWLNYDLAGHIIIKGK